MTWESTCGAHLFRHDGQRRALNFGVVLDCGYHILVNAWQQRILRRLSARPTPPEIRWTEIEAMPFAAGVEVTQRYGSRAGLRKDGERMVVHRPNPQPEVGQATVRPKARFLGAVGVQP